MKLNGLRDIEGSYSAKKRVGRGIGSGKGKTCGRGVKGQKSRSGVSLNGFEGGQMPIYRRLPKRGFNNIFSKDFNIISLGRIQEAVNSGKIDPSQPITNELLYTSGLFSRLRDGLKILSDGEITSKLSFSISAASKAAIDKIEKSGSKLDIISNKSS